MRLFISSKQKKIVRFLREYNDLWANMWNVSIPAIAVISVSGSVFALITEKVRVTGYVGCMILAKLDIILIPR